MRLRRAIGWSLGAALAGAIVGLAIGTTVTSHRVRSLRAEIARLEQSRLRLRENADALAAALREARAPLARRVHELESALAAKEAAPAPGDAAEPSLAVAAIEPVPGPERVGSLAPVPQSRNRATRGEAPSPDRSDRSAPAPALSAAAPPADTMATPPAVSAAAPPADTMATPPAVSAAPPAALPVEPPPAESPCRSLAEPEFALSSPEQTVERFAGGLVLAIDASGPGLVMRLGEDERYPLLGLPLHVATQCDGHPYIVSICVAERDPFEVRGVISPADSWHKPCRALLRARAEAVP